MEEDCYLQISRVVGVSGNSLFWAFGGKGYEKYIYIISIPSYTRRKTANFHKVNPRIQLGHNFIKLHDWQDKLLLPCLGEKRGENWVPNMLDRYIYVFAHGRSRLLRFV